MWKDTDVLPYFLIERISKNLCSEPPWEKQNYHFLDCRLIITILPHDTMHKRGLCRRAVPVRLSVSPSVRYVRVSVDTSKQFSTFSHHWVATPFCFLHTKRYGNFLTGTPNWGVECRWFRQKSWFSTNIWLSDRWLVECDQQFWRSTVMKFAWTSVYRADRHAPVNLVYHNQHRRIRRRAQGTI